MRNIVISTAVILALATIGCGANMGASGSATENDAAAVAITGGGLSVEGSETEADMNAKIFEVVAQKVEEEINAELEDGELGYEIEAAQASGLAAKDLTVGLGSRGLSVFITDEEIPFAGGKMILNGEVGLKLRFKSWGHIQLIASGELSSDLVGVERNGAVKDIPYYLALDGSNLMEMEGSFDVIIKRWKVRSMSANLTSSIVESDVTATGSIADREVEGSVDMVDVSISISNDDFLKDPKNVVIECTGEISTSINDNEFASCEIAPSCLGCL